jgi:ABC-type transport system involved in multi-copper enzyme maturation permease subunit
VRNRSIWVTFAMYLVMSVGFGVGMTYAIYKGMAGDAAEAAADPALAAQIEGFRESFLLANFDGFVAGLLPFWGAATALALGVMVVGSQYAKRTVNIIYTQGSSRVAVLMAQIIALAGLLALLVAATAAVNAAGCAVVSAVEGWEIAAPPLGATLVSALTTYLTALTYGIVGVALAVVTRSEMQALGIGLVWFLGIETVLVLVFGALGWVDAGQFTLAGATSDLAVARGAYPWWPNSLTDQATTAQGVAGAIIQMGWLALAAGTALGLIRRRDI